jgi:hypothetical protein
VRCDDERVEAFGPHRAPRSPRVRGCTGRRDRG